MKILIVHQNFPGQYKHIVTWLASRATQVVALSQRDAPPIKGVTHIRYEPHHKPAKNAYALTSYWEECAGNGYGVVRAAQKLAEDGFAPDLVLGHIGWGELTFLKQVWPATKILGYFEYFYLASGGSVGFDPEFPASADAPFIMHARNAVNFANIQTVDLGMSPTHWQRNTFPESFHDKLFVCHDGIRTDQLHRDQNAALPLGRLGRSVTHDDEIFTYMARNMEPVRGFHQFMRALPKILAARPNARAIVVGGNDTSYGKKSGDEGGYRGQMESEVGHLIDWDRVHFIGKVPYADFCRVIQVSRCHIYLTVPFVLSWSMLEAMAMEATIVASDVPPVREVLQHGETGILTDFFDADALAAKVIDVLERPGDYAHLGPKARAHVVEHHDYTTRSLPEQVRRMNSLLPRSLQLA
ncbi:MAG: glycosyltransferase family 4 protein [Pseudomonadota bacterium]